MKYNTIIRGGSLDIEGWHKRAMEVLDTKGIASCISTQSNNLLQKVIIYDEC